MNTCGYSSYVTPTLIRKWLCHVQLLLVFASAVILRSGSRGAHDHILLFQNRAFSKVEGQVPVFISPMNSGPVIPPDTGFPFHRLLRLWGLRWRHWTPPPHGTADLTWSAPLASL
jgi:hypothetical protein